MGRLYDIIDDYINRQTYPPSIRRLAKDLGVSPTTVTNWRNIKDLPRPEHLEAIARVTGVPVREVFYAAGVDAQYIIEDPPERGVPRTRVG
jgi:transcriptional regulator with XRE-family HTH domain